MTGRVLRFDPADTPRASDTAADPVGQDLLADVAAEKLKDVARYDFGEGCWRINQGGLWRRDQRELVRHALRQIIAEATSGSQSRFRIRAAEEPYQSAVERHLRRDLRLSVAAERWDQAPNLLGAPGGMIDLPTGRLVDADPEALITRMIGATPADNADCPIWLAFLDQATQSDAALIDYLQMICGCCFSALSVDHVVLLVYGPGGNGKGVFLGVLTELLGDYAATMPLDMLIERGGAQHPTEFARLRGIRAAIASELPADARWDLQKLKALSGGDKLAGRFMRQDFFEFDPQFTLIVSSNSKPTIAVVDDAIKRRLRLLPFLFKPERPDVELKRKILAEGPGVLRWMLGGAVRYLAAVAEKGRGLPDREGLPDVVRKATNEYFDDEDAIAAFLSEEAEVDPGRPEWREKASHLLDAYNAFVALEGWGAPLARQSFAQRLSLAGVTKKRLNRGWHYLGVRLRARRSRGDA